MIYVHSLSTDPLIKFEIPVTMSWKIQFVLAGFIGLILQIRGETVEEKFFEQKLDHVNGTGGTWQQRYLENVEFHKEGGPVFVYLGGPEYAPITPTALHKGSMVHYAQEQGATIIGLESRFFGKSRPTTDISTDNLNKYYNIHQVTLDTVDFVKDLKTKPEFAKSKVVGFGTIFSGSRLVYIAREFPGIFDIIVASSTPVESRFDYPDYIGKGVEILNRTDPECYETVHDGLLCLEQIVQGETCQGHNIADLKKALNLCEDLDPKDGHDVAGLFQAIVKNIGGVVAVNNPDPTFPYNVAKMCKALGDTSTGLNHLDRMGQELGKIIAFRKQSCLEFRFEKHFESLNDPSWESPSVVRGERQGYSSRCRAFPFIRSIEALHLAISEKFATSYTTDMCQRLFGITAEQIKANTDAVNLKFGGRKIPSKCGIFVSGGDDLFQSVEITTEKEAGHCNRAIVIEGAAIAKDKGEISPEGQSHPPALHTAQIEIGKVLGSWLETGDCCAADTPLFSFLF